MLEHSKAVAASDLTDNSEDCKRFYIESCSLKMIFDFNLQDQELQEMIRGMDGIIDVQLVLQKKIVVNKIDKFQEKLDTFRENIQKRC